jgi:hypothetical protein
VARYGYDHWELTARWGKERESLDGSILPLTGGEELMWRCLIDGDGWRHNNGDVGAWEWGRRCIEVTESSGIV